MKKTKGISFLLAVVMLVTLVIPGILALSANAANNGMVLNKTATANADGSYTIQLEAYATGDKVITETTKDVPTDIVLVLDQSGSMDETMNTYAFRVYSSKDNDDYYDLRHNNDSYNAKKNLYYQLTDGSYATVSVIRTQAEGTYTYTECPSSWSNDESGSWVSDPDDYWKNSENLYVKSIDGIYHKVTLTRENVGEWYNPTYIYTYTFLDGSTVVSEGSEASPDFGNKGPLYVRSAAEGEYTYTYTYTDSEGQTKTIGTSERANTVPDFTLYERYTSSNTTRLAALKTAVTNFADSVKTKAAGPDGDLSTTTDNVNHRIAVVGFATGSTTQHSGYPTWENTEVFVGSNQYNYNVNADSCYRSALQDMNTEAGYNNVIASKNALAARGATYPNYGLEMAKGILDANPVQQGETRNRVVILFTDGSPGYSSYSNEVASSAVTTAKTLKDNGVTVYSVGIFTGADASSAGIAQGNSSRQENQFMQNVSSNNGTPQSPSYYLSASDADTLNNIFQQISDQIESGGSAATLGSETVIKDIIAPAFSLPEGTVASEITLETYSCTGKNGNDYTWLKNNDRMGANAIVNDDQISVTGFNFAENYVGTVTENGEVKYRGDKLVITFDVLPKEGFLGGNNVYTNTSAGIYENSAATEPVLIFQRPQVNVPIKDVTVTGEDKHVYLLDDLTAEELSSGAVVKVGDVELNLDSTATNFGLEPWQTEYVDITIAITDEDGKKIADMNDLTDDQTYTISVTVSPKSIGVGASGIVATNKSGSDEGAVYVYKPELTFKDSIVYYGDAVPDFSSNLTDTKWKHGETEADTEKMGAAPELSLTYAPEAKKVSDGKINSKQDVAVDAAVKMDEIDITGKVGFVHTGCTDDCSWSENELDGMPAFLLHVKTCQLTITKSGGNDGEPYIFHIYKDDKEYSEVTIVGNKSESIYELPVGNYTIDEDENWSWRFDADNVNKVTLNADNVSGSITCINKQNDNIYWLNGYSVVVKNAFGSKN